MIKFKSMLKKKKLLNRYNYKDDKCQTRKNETNYLL